MNTKLKISLVIFFLFKSVFGQSADTLTIEDVFKMNLEELLNVKIKVSSVEATDVFNTPSTVTVIDENQIQVFGFTSIPEALQSIAGIDVLQTIIDKNVTTSRGVLQNFYANKILLMINNIPTYQPINGDGHLERIDINDVERIEILKGPASVLYGSNAYTGVVNIVLRQSDDFSIKGYGRLGYRNIYSSGVNLTYRKNDLKMFFSVNNGSEERTGYKMESRRGSLYNGDSTFIYNEAEYISNFNALLNYKKHSLYFNIFNFDHSFLGAEPSYRSGANEIVLNHGSLLNYKFENNLKKVRYSFDMTYDYFYRELPLSQDRSSISIVKADRLNGRLNLTYNHSDELQFETGLNYELRMSKAQETRNGITDELISLNQSQKKDVYEFSLYGQIYYCLDKFRFSAGARYTKNELFGDNLSFRLTGVYSLGKQDAVKFIYGESFRAPTFVEMFFLHETVVGNPNLKPEKSRSYELVYLKGIKNFYFQILGYYANYMNLIERYTPEAGPPSRYRNSSEVEGYGIEAELKYNLKNKFNFFLNYNYVDGMDKEDEHIYNYVPDHNLSLGISRTFGEFFVSGNCTFYSETQGHLDKIDPQLNFNLNVGCNTEFDDLSVKHIVSIKNVFNSDMLIPEYIRKTPNINSLPTTGFGRRVIYSIYVYY